MPTAVTGPIPIPAQDGLRAAAVSGGAPEVQLNRADPLFGSDRWTSGGTYRRTPCTGADLTSDCAEDNPPTPPTELGTRTFTPVIVRATRTCSTTGWSENDLRADAAQLVDFALYPQLAHELWTGTQSQADSLENTWLTDDSADGWVNLVTESGGAASDAFTPKQGLAAIEDAIGAFTNGAAIIHAPRFMLFHWADYLRIEAGRVRTIAGTLVVADRGYPGTEPDSVNVGEPDFDGAAGVWVYATGPLMLRTDPDLLITPATLAEAIDPAVNDITYTTQRKAAWSFDCPHIGVRIRLCGTC